MSDRPARASAYSNSETRAAAVTATLRSMRWWDLEQILPLERDLFSDDAWSAELFWSELAGVPATRYYVVAEDGHGIAGYAGLLIGVGEAEVQTVAVRANAQGQGLGARLLEDLLAEAGRRECRTVLLEVRVDNEPALRLYARYGFERIGRRPGYYARGSVDGLVLRRRG